MIKTHNLKPVTPFRMGRAVEGPAAYKPGAQDGAAPSSTWRMSRASCLMR